MASSLSNQHDPIWIVKDPASFSSITVKLPPNTSINCESDAVVTFPQGILVRGVMSGGILSSLARSYLTAESFFTTMVENTNRERAVEVMMAPSKPGGIILHKLSHGGRGLGREDSDGDGGDLLLTSGSYIGSDTSVNVTSEMQRISKYLSNSGLFVLRASSKKERRSNGYVAFGAYGSVHKYIVGVGETRSVDNGHLVAWSASMKYSVGLANVCSQSSIPMRLMNSLTSGEGLMCHFEGPGIVYLQSHKPDLVEANKKRRTVKSCFVFVVFLTFLIGIIVFYWIVAMIQNDRYPREQREF